MSDTIKGAEAAKLLGVSYSHLYKLIEEGKLQRLEEASELKKHAPLSFRRSQVEALAQRIKKSSVAA